MGGIDLSPLVGCPALPFIDLGGSRGYIREKEKKTKGREGPSKESVFLSSYACPADMADRVRNGMFTDPHMVVPSPHSASGYVPSYIGGWCGVLGS